MAHHRNTDDRERALTERARQRDRNRQLGECRDAAHHDDRDPERRGDAREHGSAAESIEEPADADGAGGAD